MYAKVNNGIIEKYPYTISDLQNEMPNTSFPSSMPDERLQDFGVYLVEITQQPAYNKFTQDLIEQQPQEINGKWTQVWSVVDVSEEEHLQRIRKARANEYPPMADYLDGIVKGDQAQIQQYIDACLAVKAKYPKP